MNFKRMIAVAAVLASTAQFAVGQAPADQEQEQLKRDQLRIAVQEICPVSGGKLGAMGAPVKAKIGEELVFLCCKGCQGKEAKPEHWATIHANFAKAQGVCTVMKKPLPKNPKWTIVEGQIIYICCPPCTKKITADPQKYLRIFDELYAASLEAKKHGHAK